LFRDARQTESFGGIYEEIKQKIAQDGNIHEPIDENAAGQKRGRESHACRHVVGKFHRPGEHGRAAARVTRDDGLFDSELFDRTAD
jgi:hypothetical protein